MHAVPVFPLSLSRPSRLPAFFLLLTAACGDDAGTGSTSTSSSSMTATSSATSASTATGGVGGSGGDGGGSVETIPYVYVGTSADKILVMLLDRATGELAPVGEVDGGPNPSFLATDPGHRFVFAANEASSEVSSFAIDPATGELSFLSRVSSQGSGPAHVSVDASGMWLLVANYGSGHVASLRIDGDGSIDDGTVSVQLAGKNAHLIRHDPTNGVAYVPCLGSEYVTFFGLDGATGALTSPPPSGELDLPAGSGPRHLELHPTLPVAYVINELGDSIVVAERTPAGPLVELATVPTLPNGADAGSNYCADIHITPDARFLYGSNRGHDSLAIYEVDAQSGLLTPIGHQPTGGDWPRNFTIDPAGGLVLVANQQSDEIVSFRIDPSSGLLTELVTTPTEGSPAFAGIVEQPLPPP